MDSARACKAGRPRSLSRRGRRGGHNAAVPRVKLSRRLGPVGAAAALWDIWRRLPPEHRRFIAKQVRTHGPTVAKQAVKARRARRP